MEVLENSNGPQRRYGTDFRLTVQELAIVPPPRFGPAGQRRRFLTSSLTVCLVLVDKYLSATLSCSRKPRSAVSLTLALDRVHDLAIHPRMGRVVKTRRPIRDELLRLSQDRLRELLGDFVRVAQVEHRLPIHLRQRGKACAFAATAVVSINGYWE